jgi:predicted exporter
MAGEYQKVANSTRIATITWQVIALSRLAGLITFAVLTFSATQAGEISGEHTDRIGGL